MSQMGCVPGQQWPASSTQQEALGKGPVVPRVRGVRMMQAGMGTDSSRSGGRGRRAYADSSKWSLRGRWWSDRKRLLGAEAMAERAGRVLATVRERTPPGRRAPLPARTSPQAHRRYALG